LYLPEEWAEDKERRERAGVPEEVGMRTKPELAKVMLGRALDAGVKAAWVVADSVYGDSRRLGMFLEEGEQPYVLAVSGKAYVWAGLRQHRVGEVLEALGRGELLPEEGFRRISVGDGSTGPRLYDWLRLPLNPPMQEGFQRWLVVRRSIEDPEELSAYTVFALEGIMLEALAKAAGSRWRVEISFEEAKGEVGLAHYEVRSWHGWYRHITLSLFAHAFLATIRAAGLDIRTPEKGGSKKPWKPLGVQEKARTLVELTVAEVRRLLCRMVLVGRAARWGEVLSWSSWRRHHQAVARRCHYKRRGVLLA
jgi:DDE superfamily endonuclease